LHWRCHWSRLTDRLAHQRDRLWARHCSRLTSCMWTYDQVHWWVERWERVDHCIENRCHWSRLTSDSGLLHSRACFVHWSTQSKDQSLSIFVADSLRVSFKQTNYRVTDSMTRSISNASLKQAHCWTCHCSRLTMRRSIDSLKRSIRIASL